MKLRCHPPSSLTPNSHSRVLPLTKNFFLTLFCSLSPPPPSPFFPPSLSLSRWGRCLSVMLMLFSRHFSFASLWSTRSGWRRWGVLRLCCEDLMEWEQGGETTGERNRGVERPGERRGIKEEARERGAHILVHMWTHAKSEDSFLSTWYIFFYMPSKHVNMWLLEAAVQR